jgi:acyl carrier protein
MDQYFNMNSEEILNNLKIIFQDIFDDDELEVSKETTAEDIEDWDSLTHINLVVTIEKEFHLKFSLGELQALKNVGDMVNLVIKKKTSQTI